jgi:hypothetical protein
MSRCELVREKQRLILIIDIRPTAFTSAQLPQPLAIAAPPKKAPEPAPATKESTGIVLNRGWDTPMQGGSRTMQDLAQVFSLIAKPALNLAPAATIEIYEGITYLSPVQTALEKLHVQNRPTSKNAVACSGLPRDSLFYYAIDGTFEGHYNRLYLVVDRADQVVCVQLVDEHPRTASDVNSLKGDWATYNFINSRMKASKELEVRYRLSSLRKANNWADFMPSYPASATTAASASLFRLDCTLLDARRIPSSRRVLESQRVLEDVRWYVPRPLVELSLFCIQTPGRSQSEVAH